MSKKKSINSMVLDLNSEPLVMELALIPAGEFLMGSPERGKDGDSNESQHKVKIARPFYMGKTQVTQAQWERVMGSNPSYLRTRITRSNACRGTTLRTFARS